MSWVLEWAICGAIGGVALLLLDGARRGSRGKQLICLLLGLLVAVFALMFALKVMRNGPSSSGGSTANGCAGNYRLCKDNEDMVNNFGGMSKARVACKIAVVDANKYGTPDFPFFAFGTFFVGNEYPKSGEVRLREKEVSIQNEYGTRVKTSIFCDYSFLVDKVLSVSSENNNLIVYADLDAREKMNKLTQNGQFVAPAAIAASAATPDSTSSADNPVASALGGSAPDAGMPNAVDSASTPDAASNYVLDEPGMPSDVKALVDAEFKLNDRCRGGSGDDSQAQVACDEREKLLPLIRARGWCWGHANDAGYQRAWVRCRPGD
ncbi:hypothetical protein BDI4_800021 [Burkholderia diffusa]|nr:hypothetical protein BDI4_800021 [Burkholderia diffusa]